MVSKTASLPHESESDSGSENGDTRAVRRAIQRRACEIERRELDRAITRLESDEELTDERARILSETAAAIAADVLAGPDTVLAESDPDERMLRLARELLG
jgi:glutamyl-tRNA reductase